MKNVHTLPTFVLLNLVFVAFVANSTDIYADFTRYEVGHLVERPKTLYESIGTTKTLDCAFECAQLSQDNCTGFRFQAQISKCTFFTGNLEIDAISQTSRITSPEPLVTLPLYKRTIQKCSDFPNFSAIDSGDDNATSEYCLAFFPQKVTWYQAKKLCESLGARLPYANSIRKMEKINDFVLISNFGFSQSWAGVKKASGHSSSYRHILTGEQIPKISVLWQKSNVGTSLMEMCAFITYGDRIAFYGCELPQMSTVCERA